MTRYRLDDLGWFAFEKLIQSLLKADLGLAVESWGGQGDLGRDCYAATQLPFPSPQTPSIGPFIFQAKFVAGANATGANWSPRLYEAVSREAKRIRDRRKANIWRAPAHYILITNCPVTAAARADIDSALRGVLPHAGITTLGADDISDLLDKHPNLRRAFPEIMSLRDLDEILSRVVNRSILERSRAAVSETRDLVPVFVPTRAYDLARQSLHKHHFVVLDGPPEMGKTAIARTIGLSLLMSGWEVVECRGPDDLFAVIDSQRSQVFVADDAFGRTEYDPGLVREWERDIPRVFHRLDARHKLIWTTRKHILARALREMDLTGQAGSFPKPGEVTVTAGDLSTEEKARILYRHSRAAALSETDRQVVRSNALRVVNNNHFTPERIRRLVCDVLPALTARRAPAPLGADEVAREIDESIRNPTERMRKSFRALPEMPKWVLTAFLDCVGPTQNDTLRSRFVAFQPLTTERRFQESLEDVLGTFLKLSPARVSWEGASVDWIHPSYRDLVIDELSGSAVEQATFLSRASTVGITLALSLEGGRSGERQMPFITSADGWALLGSRCCALATSGDDLVVTQLIDALLGALKADRLPEAGRAHATSTIRAVCEIATRRWTNDACEPTVDMLRALRRVFAALGRPFALPDLARWLTMAEKSLREEMDSGDIPDGTILDRWSVLRDLVQECFPAIAKHGEFVDSQAQLLHGLFGLAEAIAGAGANLSDPESNETEGRRLEEFAESLRLLDIDCTYEEVAEQMFRLAEEYKENGPAEDNPGFELEDRSVTRHEFDLEAFFADL